MLQAFMTPHNKILFNKVPLREGLPLAYLLFQETQSTNFSSASPTYLFATLFFTFLTLKMFLVKGKGKKKTRLVSTNFMWLSFLQTPEVSDREFSSSRL